MRGIKESLSLEGVDFEGTAPAEVPRPGGRDGLPIALVRAPGEQAHYFVEESLDLYRKLLGSLAARDDVGVLLSPRYDGQERLLEEFSWTIPPAVLREAVPFVSLLKAVDLVVSSGGTMAREAAFLGIPSYSILRSAIGQVDLYLESLGRLDRHPVGGGALEDRGRPRALARAARAPRRPPRRRRSRRRCSGSPRPARRGRAAPSGASAPEADGRRAGRYAA